MAASLKQDYAKILKAEANLVMISPDSVEVHRQYALTLFRDELPYLYVSDGDLDIAPILRLVLTCDHRAIDGADGAQFLQTLVALIEQPSLAL